MSRKPWSRIFRTCVALLACAAAFAMVRAQLNEPKESALRGAREPAAGRPAVEPDIDSINTEVSKGALVPAFTADAPVDSHTDTSSLGAAPDNTVSSAAIAAVLESTPELEAALEEALIDADAVQRKQNAQDALKLLNTLAERREEAASLR